MYVLTPRVRWLAAALFLTLATAVPYGPAAAQEVAEEEPVELQRFSVTGYSVKRTEIEGPAPVDVYSREEIEQAGANTLGEFFRYLPQAVGPISETFQGSGFGGASFINLRGIGIDNTLTLLNGKRVSAYAVNGSAKPFVDINAIPVAAIERVEILKDGASAIYGADAVAGVVNIILRDTFEGLQVGGGYLTTTEGDGDEWTADGVWGWNDDDTSVLATFSFFDKSPILARDRAWSDDVDFRAEGGPNLRAFNGTPSTYFDLSTFQIIPDPECGVEPAISSIATFPFFGDFCAFNYAWFQQLTYDTQTVGGNLTVKHEFSSTLRGRFELFYSRRDNSARLAPTPVMGGFIPPNHPDNPFGAPLELAGRPLDTGDRLFENTADTYRLVAGLAGYRGSWDWSADLLATGNHVDTDRRNAVFTDRYHAALQGMGGPNGDGWYNPFGANPQNDPALIDWLTTDTRFGADTTENAIELEASTFFGALPGGPVGFAGGLQYREQELDEFADEIERSGLLSGGNLITQIQADRDILAAYAEFNLPLHPKLEAQLALRYDDYSDFGGTTNPKLALAWRPTRDWLFRASYSTSFRPPAFTELFNPAVPNSGFFTDVERCEGTGAQQDCAPFPYLLVNVGNPDLQPEEGTSVFVGVVWSPEFLEGFDFEIDYWRFEHTERIIELDPQLILDAKSDKGVLRGPPSDEDIALGVPGRILQLTETFENSDELDTSGIDVTARYSRQTASAGIFGLTLAYTYVDEYILNEATLGSAQAGVNFAGKYFNREFGIPQHRGNLGLEWQRGPHGMAMNLHYTGDYEGAFNRYENGVDTGTPWVVDSLTTLDLQYSYLFSNQRTQLRLGCRNCTDEAPPVTFNFLGEGLYDYRGALLYLRLQHQF
jgi:iron complex outermembrane receptor protein